MQTRLVLFPDGDRSLAPRISELRIHFRRDLPPPPPSSLSGIAGDGGIVLSWPQVQDSDVGGYMVFYGYGPLDYSTVIDVGTATRYELEGLENGRLYFFSVISYDGADPPHKSGFSEEISLRPSGLPQ